MSDTNAGGPGGGVGDEHGATLFETALGSVGVAWQGPVVTAVSLPEGSEAATLRRVKAKGADGVSEGSGRDRSDRQPPAEVAEAIEAMTRLLAGESVDLSFVEIAIDHLPAFDQDVYRVTRGIGPGSSLTYGEVAEAIGQPGAAQAVGRSLGANPVPIVVPCHRVLGAGGALTGFSAAGGVETKRRMLLIEGCPAVPPSLFDQLS